MSSRLSALPNELLDMITSHLSPGSITAMRAANSDLRARLDPPPPFNLQSIADVELKSANAAACLFVCSHCRHLRSASQFELKMVAKDMLDAFIRSARHSMAFRTAASSAASYTVATGRYCVSCCVNTRMSGPGTFGYPNYGCVLMHPVKLDRGWDWEYAILYRKCDMVGKRIGSFEELSDDWCGRCIKMELERTGADGTGTQGIKRKHDDAAEE